MARGGATEKESDWTSLGVVCSRGMGDVKCTIGFPVMVVGKVVLVVLLVVLFRDSVVVVVVMGVMKEGVVRPEWLACVGERVISPPTTPMS